ncbi:protein IWS1 homolog [Penaeus monodon]|uniref:protein IWS1 homolog n=1 Tax=Penaeus monodon TaxID=6687 RepID=UPI0018A7247C|nr:protein IWS1 homolog [Penaeus monodon]
MLAKKKEEAGRHRRRKNNVDIINDNEEHIAIIVSKMREAADEDRQLNAKRLPATKKSAMLELAMSQINKQNLIEGFLDANVLSALTDWLAPMPDRSLPAVKIREAVTKWLLSVCNRWKTYLCTNPTCDRENSMTLAQCNVQRL